MNRRKFLTILGSAGVVSALGTAKVAEASVHTFPYSVSYTHLTLPTT